MAIPMSAQQIAELQKKKYNIPPAFAGNQAPINVPKPMAAMPKPSIGGVVPPKMPSPIAPKAGMPQAAQVKPKGVIPNMPIPSSPKNLIGTPGQTAKPTNLIGTPKPSVATPMSAQAAGATPKPNNMTANGGYIPNSLLTPGTKGNITNQPYAGGSTITNQSGSAQPTANGGYVPPSDITTPQDGSDLWNTAGGFYADERASLENTVNSQANSIKGNAEWVNKLIGDQRVLENESFLRNNAPVGWDGSAGYRATQLSRGREIDDTLRGGELLNQLNANQAELANFDKLAPERQRQIYAGLLEKERAYGLGVGNQAINEGQLTGEYFNPKAQNIANQIIGLKQQAEAPGITAEQRAALSTKANGLRGQLSNMGYNADQFGANVNSSAAQGNMSGLGQKTIGQQSQDFGERSNIRDYKRGVYESDRNFNEGVRQDNRNFEYTQGRDARKDAEWEAEFNRIKDQDGIQNALAFANQSLNETEFEDSSAYKWAGLDAELASAASEGEKYQGMSANDVVNNVRKNFDDGDGGLLTDTASRDQMYMQIIGAGLPQNQEDQALAAIGFTPDQIKKLDDKYLGK